METVVGSRGRIVIPSKLRRRLGIAIRTRIIVESDAVGRIILKPVTRAYVHSLRGRLKGSGLLRALAAAKIGEKKREGHKGNFKPKTFKRTAKTHTWKRQFVELNYA